MSERIIFQLENMQSLVSELNKMIEEMKEYFENEMNGHEIDRGDYIG